MILLALPIQLLLLSGCELPAEPPHIEINSVGLQKIPLKESGITSYTQFAVFSKGVDPEHLEKYLKDRKDVEAKMQKIFGRDCAWWYCEVRFMGKDYYLVNYRESNKTVDVIGKQDRQTVLNLNSSFPVNSFAAREVVMNDRPYLIVYIDSMGRYGELNKSALYIVNADFKVVYREILTRAKEIGWTSDKQYGNCIVLRSIDHWRKTSDDEWQPIIGDWVYYLPMQKSKPNVMSQQKTKVPEQ